jgi:hypothetical protein
VVYKVDRLTRSLADFAKLVELFDAHGVSFVSLTQQFNTTTSMGRLTLNVLLSFAQFEREVTSERIRDKIGASKRRGLWVGGMVPLGYVSRDEKLVIDEEDAERVRTIFRRYLQVGSIGRLLVDLRDRGIVTKIRYLSDGRAVGGIPFTRGPLAYLLRNRFYTKSDGADPYSTRSNRRYSMRRVAHGLRGDFWIMHSRAEKLADRFNLASVRRMAKGNERDAPTEPLFHYTSAAALAAIIVSETFWFTSVYHMDDDQELSFGFGISHSLLAAALEREDANVKVFLKPLVEDVGFSRIKKRFNSTPPASVRRTMPGSGPNMPTAARASR